MALVDVLGGEEEAVIVEPQGALKLAKIARHVDEAAVPVGTRGPGIAGQGVDRVVPRQGRAPVVVIELTREELRVRGAVARGGVVGVVVVGRLLVDAEASVLGPGERQGVEMAEEHGFAIARLDERRRQDALRVPARVEGPDGVGALVRHVGMELDARRELPQGHDDPRRGQELLPSLMGEELAGRAALERPYARPGIDELRSARGGEVRVIGQPPPVQLAQPRGEDDLGLIARRDRRQGHRRLKDEPGHGLRERQGPEQRARRRAGRDGRVRAPDEGAQAMLGGQQTAGGEESPFDQLSSRDLSLGQCPDDLGSIVAGVLCLSQARPRRFA